VRLLVIEDENRLSAILQTTLGASGFVVDIAGSAADAGAALELINYDAAILDLGLPDGDGLAVLASARRIGKTLPILILTARDAVDDRVAGLDAGADDYLTKPFAMTELIARVKALLRHLDDLSGQRLGLAVKQCFSCKRGAVACTPGLATGIPGTAFRKRPPPLYSRCICSHRTQPHTCAIRWPYRPPHRQSDYICELET
jgi:DNA-binding response OmpR family regulator